VFQPRPAIHRGFTLIEILVVMLIIGIMVTGAVLTSGLAHGDRDLERERDRLVALTSHLRDMASLQNREYGLRCFEGGYEFLVFDARSGLWQRDARDDSLRPRQLPRGLSLALAVEGRPVVLPPADERRADALAPQVMLYSSGDLSLFELTLTREPDGPTVRIAPSASSESIEAAGPEGQPS
jgi:general secretion pathway protein H